MQPELTDGEGDVVQRAPVNFCEWALGLQMLEILLSCTSQLQGVRSDRLLAFGPKILDAGSDLFSALRAKQTS